MLTMLNIENIAVIEKAEIEFGRGFNALTGETGAGKSMVIDSLEAALGWRTSGQLVRRGAKSAQVTAVFTPDGAEDWCRENGIDCDDELILQRRINEDGKSSCRINGVPVPASLMRQLGLLLIDIHSQGDGQRLADERYHRQYLDTFAGIDGLLSDYAAAYRRYRDAVNELEGFTMDEGEKARRVDMLTYQINELERACIKPGEYDEISKRRDFLKNAGKLMGAVSDASAAIRGGDRSDGALSLVESALDAVSRALKYADELTPIHTKLTELRYSCEDAADELRGFQDSLEFSPDEFDELDDRIDTLKRIFRKYGGNEEEALSFLNRCRDELNEIEYADEKREKLEKEAEKRRADAERLAEKLTAERMSASKKLADSIKQELGALSMGGAEFEVSIEKADDLGPHGRDDVKFLMSANRGEAMGRISKVASGGERSRIMLAMKTVLSSGDSVQSMVFDEIDTGISGIAAQRVAERIAMVAAGKQVICVTHLPQIAAMADTHFSIEKRETDGRTYTNVTRLDRDGRVGEIARLTGGELTTEAIIKSAGDIITQADIFRSNLK